MRIANQFVATTLAAAALFGLSGGLSVANAAAPVDATASGQAGEMTAQGTRAFWVQNLTGTALTLAEAQGTTGWQPNRPGDLLPGDSVPVGQQLLPGQTMRVEVKDFSDHGIRLRFTGEGAAVTVFTYVDGLMRYSSGTSNLGPVDAGGQDITLRSPAGSVTTIPSTDRATQSALADSLCGRGDATCSFKPTKFEESTMKYNPDGSPDFSGLVTGEDHFVGHALRNTGSLVQKLSFEMSDKVATTTSLELSSKVAAGVEGIVSAEVSTTFRTDWLKEHTFTTTVDMNVPGGQMGWVTVSEPVKRFTGDMVVTFGDATYVLKDVTYETPDDRFPSIFTEHFKKLDGSASTATTATLDPRVAAAGGEDYSVSTLIDN